MVRYAAALAMLQDWMERMDCRMGGGLGWELRVATGLLIVLGRSLG